MGNTRKRIPYFCCRHPKGRKQAKINNARHGAIPPDPWDDKQHCHSISVFWDLLMQLDDEGIPWSEIAEKLSKKYKISKQRILHELQIRKQRWFVWKNCYNYKFTH